MDFHILVGVLITFSWTTFFVTMEKLFPFELRCNSLIGVYDLIHPRKLLPWLTSLFDSFFCLLLIPTPIWIIDQLMNGINGTMFFLFVWRKSHNMSFVTNQNELRLIIEQKMFSPT